jgi:hypothetical protein
LNSEVPSEQSVVVRRPEDSFQEELKVTDIKMPQLRQPRSLQDISAQKYVNVYCGVCERWILQLYAAARSSSSDYFNISRSVEAECR